MRRLTCSDPTAAQNRPESRPRGVRAPRGARHGRQPHLGADDALNDLASAISLAVWVTRPLEEKLLTTIEAIGYDSTVEHLAGALGWGIDRVSAFISVLLSPPDGGLAPCQCGAGSQTQARDRREAADGEPEIERSAQAEGPPQESLVVVAGQKDPCGDGKPTDTTAPDGTLATGTTACTPTSTYKGG